MSRRLQYLLVLSFICMSFAVPGCESEQEFEGAPSAKAPSAKAPSSIEGTGSDKQRTDKSTRGEMPADHPPVGSSQGTDSQGLGTASSGTGEIKDGTSGPIRWTAPEQWKGVKPASSMRYAQYIISTDSGKPLSLNIFFFGPRGGGSIEQNIERWTGQFDTSAGSKPEIGERQVNGMTVHTVDVAGKYDAGAAMGGGAPKENQRMLAAIAEAPSGNYFIKLVGPHGAVTEHTDDFEAFISSLEPAGR